MKTSLLAALVLVASNISAKTWRVGPARQYTAPSQVMALVSNGDTVEIDAGLYVQDVGVWNADSLVLRCSSGYAHLDAQGTAAQRKGIWVINGKRNYVEGIEFSGCAISEADGDNGAGIRLQSTSLHCRRCYFHDNQDGILTGNDTANEITIEACEFYHNGVESGSAAGYEHNIYIGHSRFAIVKFCYFHDAVQGHELKSRANINYILYNHIVDGPTGDGSLSIDLPNGGLSYVIGNTIEKGPATSNHTILGYGEEGIINPDSEYYFINNTVVTDWTNARFATIATGAKAKIINNVIAGVIQPFNFTADTISNIINSDTAFFHFRNAQAYDYSITAPFPGITSATDPGTAHGFSLRPVSMYVDPLDSASRNDVPLQIGAFAIPSKQFVGASSAVSAAIIYPNPFGHTATISLPPTFVGERVTVSVFNDAGVLAVREELPVNAASVQLDRGALPAGVYRYLVTAPSGVAVCSGSAVIVW